ncbi:alpha/beta hydrolase [Actinoplanes sp. NPDC051859]|uniref:alpha/beta hydrolase n=1 Tax=Actinoplanes sp. NPDC051859 TaxID=3363909 RepID=UPI00379D6F1A
MSLQGTPVLIAGIVAVLLSAVLIAVIWERGGRLRLLLRSAAVAVALLSVTATVLVQLNRMTEAYSLAEEPESAAPEQTASTDTDSGDSDSDSDAPAPVAQKTGSQVRKFTVPGKASGLNLTMYVYLPAAYQAGGKQRFPVIQAFHGYPGSPRTWLKKLKVQERLDAEIAAGRMSPTVVLFPFQTPEQLLDTECTNMQGGPQTETFLTVDVPAFAKAKFRIHTDRTGWGLIGYSAGAYCVSSLLLRHPQLYSAGASMSGLSGPAINVGDGKEATEHDVVWRLKNLPRPAVALWIGWAKDEQAIRRDSELIAAHATAPIRLTTAVVERGGHSHAVWRQMLPPAFDWLSAQLARPHP